MVTSGEERALGSLPRSSNIYSSIMVRILGIGSKNKATKNKRRTKGGRGLSADDIRREHPMYQYAMEEYGEKPLRFRARARYVGP